MAFGFKVDEVFLVELFCWKRIMPVMEEIGFFLPSSKASFPARKKAVPSPCAYSPLMRTFLALMNLPIKWRKNQ
jgi:hypothetical protein